MSSMALKAAVSESETILFSVEMPALLTAMSRRPCRLAMASIMRLTSASLVTSFWMKCAAPPDPVDAAARISSTARAPSRSRRPLMTTTAPWAASALATSLPIPVAPPVMRATGVDMANLLFRVVVGSNCLLPRPT